MWLELSVGGIFCSCDASTHFSLILWCDLACVHACIIACASSLRGVTVLLCSQCNEGFKLPIFSITGEIFSTGDPCVLILDR